ncbi:hypothetical protein WICMUC_002855 [Wickerhamomyces mucosus]|uniref:Mitochondrial thiamine pyrophosphate carrier 1 n=1 Tax=Wickerhamomyces mucosus TaxID=1378264 RepID=A0A9P8PMT5_9ASCO|nr:hypothetical protein WICMUC_002855 [Wickerhamomyces mucosus]
MKVVVKEQGLIGLWRGNVPAATMYVIYGAIQFSSYSYYNTLLSDLEEYNNLKVPPSIHSLILGSMAGCTGSLVSYPFDLLRTRFVSNSKISSIVGTIRSINKTEGFHAFFKGLNAGLVSISVYSGLMFWSYETSMMIFQRLEFDSYPILSNFVEPACGFVAGFTAKTIVFPLDLIRKRLQINTGRNMNFISAGFKVIRHEGPKGLYKGFLASVIKSAPTTAISLWTYEFVLRTSESMKKVLR